MSERYRLRLVGESVRLYRGDVPVRIDTRARLLVAYLALAGPTSRDRLAELLWPDADRRRALGNFRQLLFRLRQAAPVVRGPPLHLDPGVWIDVHAVLADPLADGDSGGLLMAVDASFSVSFEEWLHAERTRFAHTVQMRLSERLADARARGRYDLAIVAARRSLAFDPLSEDAYRTLMDLQIEVGDVSGALETSKRCRDVLELHFDASPAPRTVALGKRAAALLAEQVRAAPTVISVTDFEGVTASSAVESDAVESDAVSGATTAVRPFDAATVARRAESGGWLREGATLLRLAAGQTIDRVERGAIHVNLAWLEHQLGNDDAATKAAEAGVAALRSVSDATALVDGLFVLGSLASHRGDDDAARTWWTEALTRLDDAVEERDGARGRAGVHLNLGLVEDALHDADAACEHYVAAIRAARPGSDDPILAVALNNLAHEMLERGRTDEADTLLRRALALANSAGNRQLEGHALDGMAQLAVCNGDGRTARTLASRSVELAREVGDRALELDALTTLASSWRVLGDDDAAAAVARAALAVAGPHGSRSRVARALLELARALGPDTEQAGVLLDALEHDVRVPSRLREAAKRSPRGRRTSRRTVTIDEALHVTLA